jgi:hypothetical protein
MRSWWMMAIVAVVAHCGGSSERRERSGDGDGSEDGGTSGTGGARGGAAGTSTAGVGTTMTGGGGVLRGGSGGYAGAAGSDGGAAGEPGCTPRLVGPSECSHEETCRALECGAPWSLYDEEGCERTECTETATCRAGERCVPAPVLGKYDDPCFYHPDSCDLYEGECSCAVWEECLPLAVCLPVAEFPPERDCPIDDPMDCAALAGAVETLGVYRDGTEFFFPYDPPEALDASVESCAMRLARALQVACD